MQEYKLSSVGQKHLPLIEKDKDEMIVYEIRKHPFGMVSIYATGIFVALAILAVGLVIMYALRRDEFGLGQDLSSLGAVALLLCGLLSILSLIVAAIAAYLYQSNVVYVTNEKIAQVLYTTLFDRKISQLSIGDVQDVTTRQAGLFARLFNYGTLVIETAGEQSNYMFSFTPRPYEASRVIVNAHEENLKKYGN